jgi:hypothetical protein
LVEIHVRGLSCQHGLMAVLSSGSQSGYPALGSTGTQCPECARKYFRCPCAGGGTPKCPSKLKSERTYSYTRTLAPSVGNQRGGISAFVDASLRYLCANNTDTTGCITARGLNATIGASIQSHLRKCRPISIYNARTSRLQARCLVQPNLKDADACRIHIQHIFCTPEPKILQPVLERPESRRSVDVDAMTIETIRPVEETRSDGTPHRNVNNANNQAATVHLYVASSNHSTNTNLGLFRLPRKQNLTRVFLRPIRR